MSILMKMPAGPSCPPELEPARLTSGEKQEQIQRIVGLLMTYQIIFRGYFGDDEAFVDLALRVFFEMLRS